MSQTQNHTVRRKKKRIHPLAAVLATALAIVALAGLVLYALGYRYISTDGVKFSGRVKNGQPVSGTVKYADGLSGKLTKEADSALGRIVYSTGDVYEGELKGVSRHGKGTVTYKDSGAVYSGDFTDDHLTGEAVYTTPDGLSYTGSVTDGKPNGRGKYVFADGSYYYGDWSDGKRNGTGEEHYADGSYYYGAFTDDKRDGNVEVTVTLENGMVYIGKNKYVFSAGDTYVGDYSNGKRSGNGTYTWVTGQSYTGEFAGDTMEGMGTYDFGGGKTPYTGVFAGGQIAEVEAENVNTPLDSDTAATDESTELQA